MILPGIHENCGMQRLRLAYNNDKNITDNTAFILNLKMC